MRRGVRGCVLVVALIAGLSVGLALQATTVAQAAAARLPVGSNGHGVRVHLTHRAWIFSLSRRAYREIAGRRIAAGCTQLVELGPTGYAIETSGLGDSFRAPARRASLSVPGSPGRWDYCTIKIAATKRTQAREIAAVPITERGAAYLSERETAGEVLGVLTLGAGLKPGEPPLSAASIERLTRGRVVPLPGPDTRPPGNAAAGYWTDGSAEVYVAALTYDGTLFFWDTNLATGVDTTNVFGWVSGQND